MVCEMMTNSVATLGWRPEHCCCLLFAKVPEKVVSSTGTESEMSCSDEHLLVDVGLAHALNFGLGNHRVPHGMIQCGDQLQADT